ncbi:CLUMA_CG012399, isoform A [Clunio marinus]|uniref:CLUMA_CG012399, isoform A n=1 Tax=Clunio marinus TaxID=568069 RepID=A0A1J1IEW8_9DIPT|nr:CLUMA_CG012399, isoform A [Clunio marinus]
MNRRLSHKLYLMLRNVTFSNIYALIPTQTNQDKNMFTFNVHKSLFMMFYDVSRNLKTTQSIPDKDLLACNILAKHHKNIDFSFTCFFPQTVAIFKY